MLSRSADLGLDFSAFLWFCASRNWQLLLVPRLSCVELVDLAFALALLLDVILFVGTFTPTVFWLFFASLLFAVGVLDLVALQIAMLLGGSVSLDRCQLRCSWCP